MKACWFTLVMLLQDQLYVVVEPQQDTQVALP